MPTMLEHTANRFMEVLGDGWKLSGNATNTSKRVSKGKRCFVLTHPVDTRLQVVECQMRRKTLKLEIGLHKKSAVFSNMPTPEFESFDEAIEKFIAFNVK